MKPTVRSSKICANPWVGQDSKGIPRNSLIINVLYSTNDVKEHGAYHTLTDPWSGDI